MVDTGYSNDVDTIVANNLDQGETMEAAEQLDEEPLPPPSIQQALNGLHVLLRIKHTARMLRWRIYGY